MAEALNEPEDLKARAEAARLKETVGCADEDTLRLLLTQARSHHGWDGRAIGEETLKAVHELAKWGPTSMNQQPARYLYLRSEAAKERLRPHLAPTNIDKTMTAPVVAIVCYDEAFYEHLPRLFPQIGHARDIYANNAALAQENAVRNGTLQGAYFMIAARAVGLDCGPISGFNRQAVDKEFFCDTTWRTNFICCLGHGDPEKLGRRGPRLGFDEVSRTL